MNGVGTRFGFALWMLAGLTYAQTGRDGYPPLGKLVDAGGHRVHVYCTGAGAQTVMIAGSGFSFDWGLVQPEIARFARVCSYDPSGTAWSDPNPTASCTQRIDEIRMVMRRAGIHGPVILVGHSIGGAMVRLLCGAVSERRGGDGDRRSCRQVSGSAGNADGGEVVRPGGSFSKAACFESAAAQVGRGVAGRIYAGAGDVPTVHGAVGGSYDRAAQSAG